MSKDWEDVYRFQLPVPKIESGIYKYTWEATFTGHSHEGDKFMFTVPKQPHDFGKIVKDEQQTKEFFKNIFLIIVESLEGELKEIVKSSTFIAGGAIREYIQGNEINDFDLYFKNEDDANKAKEIIQKALDTKEGKFSDADKMKFTFKSFETSFLSENALTFTHIDLGKPVQLIYKFGGPPDRVIDLFDFTNSMAYYDPQNDRLVYGDGFEAAIIEKELVFNEDCLNPTFALSRLLKFYKMGYKVGRGELLKIAEEAYHDEDNHEAFEKGKDIY